MKRWKPNLRSLISVLSLLTLSLALPAKAEEPSADQVLKAAKEAYSQDRCKEALSGFKKYLSMASSDSSVPDKRKAVQAAVAWCEKQMRLASSRHMEIVGAAPYPHRGPIPGPAPLAAPKPSIGPKTLVLPAETGESKPILP